MELKYPIVSHIGTFEAIHDGVGLWGKRFDPEDHTKDLFTFNAIVLFGRFYNEIKRDDPNKNWYTYDDLMLHDICCQHRIYLDNVDGNWLINEYSGLKSKSGFIRPHNILNWMPNLHYLNGGHYGHTGV